MTLQVHGCLVYEVDAELGDQFGDHRSDLVISDLEGWVAFSAIASVGIHGHLTGLNTLAQRLFCDTQNSNDVHALEPVWPEEDDNEARQ